ncbi:septum site-determining protein MinC [Roseibium hamelinense]|uniref:Probable septum site-determining protein MinC n=1 Tax=Roseibium hamelinense TaxID=150831 RepID=A0A562T3A3_9HYPH|nr:septum site-determining protein MinC [Roseibium hamelinense]MTI44459.1 septum formation inhibitor MinC [Roseibium hamelinense]TWI87426.1 septum site-determining protein MinC [Roseibium hamelinense]
MKFKGKSFIAIVLTPDQPYDEWFAEIDRIIARSPGFFIDRPIILDVRGKKMPIEDLETLLDGMASRSIRVMGIDGIAGTRLKPGMPPSFAGGRLASDVEVPDTPGAVAAPHDETAAARSQSEKKTSKSTSKTAKNGSASEKTSARKSGDRAPVTIPSSSDPQSILISEPVRSGQSIMHPSGDVTVVGSVSSGAEIIAGGSIHVYGTLRGRALAGVSGNETARIFCSKLDAELVSINGLYKVADDFDAELLNTAAQIRFEDENLVFEKLD